MGIRSFFREKASSILGVEVRRIASEYSDHGQLVRIVGSHHVNCVLDVGANKGQYAAGLLRAGYRGSIVSFEPLSTAYAVLSLRAAKFSNWKVYERCALGESSSSMEINVSNNSVSSSFLKLSTRSKSHYEKAKYVSRERVPVRPLDSIWAQIKKENAGRFLLKIDTQGFEEQVLLGAAEALNEIDVLQFEASLTPLYEGVRSWVELIELVKSKGFHVIGLQKGFVDPITGHGQQVDILASRHGF